MDLNSRCVILAQPSAVWDDLSDPEIFRTCIPGCEALA
jgi:carbon monoxide dehydrogenase subunit G